MKGLHATIIPCRSVRNRGGVLSLSGVSNILWTDGSVPFIVDRAAVFIRLKGRRIAGRLDLRLVSPGGQLLREESQEIQPFDILGISETWFDLRWLELPGTGHYNLVLAIDGDEIGDAPVLVV